MERPDPTAILNADNLEDLEAHALTEGTEGVTYAPAITLADAVEALRRIRYHKERIADTQADADALIAPLQAQIDQVKAWSAEDIGDRQKRIQIQEARFRAYCDTHPPAKGRTVKAPGGRGSYHSQAPEWKFADEGLVAALLVQNHLPFFRTKVEVAKSDLKKAAVIQDGKVLVPNVNGVLIELPEVTVVERPDTFTVEVD